MRISLFVSICLVALCLTSCKKDKEGSLTVHFIAYYDGHPLQMFSPQDFTGNQNLQFSHLSFLLSDLSLTKGSEETELKDIALVDLSFDDLTNASEGFIITTYDLPEGEYDGIRFGIGVPADINNDLPSDYASNHPLSKTSYYWVAWNSYIFQKIEGSLDTLGNGNFDTGFAYHTGTNNLYSILESPPIPINIQADGDTHIHIAIDYKDLLEGIEIKENPQNHNPTDSIYIARIVNNIPTSVTLFQ
ncbi:MAG: hypothetical protein M3R25_04575 [Bacteroidota bacterium]|nr:hypothetical protein [Bacteroidota bacterium]